MQSDNQLFILNEILEQELSDFFEVSDILNQNHLVLPQRSFLIKNVTELMFNDYDFFQAPDINFEFNSLANQSYLLAKFTSRQLKNSIENIQYIITDNTGTKCKIVNFKSENHIYNIDLFEKSFGIFEKLLKNNIQNNLVLCTHPDYIISKEIKIDSNDLFDDDSKKELIESLGYYTIDNNVFSAIDKILTLEKNVRIFG